MIRRAVIYSATVLAIAGFALLAIWCWDQVLCVYGYIRERGDWIGSVVVVLFALALLLCRWWRALKQRKGAPPVPQEHCCEKACNYEQGHGCRARPYPDPGWKCITGIRFKSDLCLARLKERDPRFGPEQQYIVAKDYFVRVELDGNKNLCLKVPGGMVTDLASAPRAIRSFVGRVGPHLEASIIHDYLYVAWQIFGLAPTDDMRLFADKVMLATMLASGMGCKAYAIYWAIRLFGTCIFYGRNPAPWILEKEDMPNCCYREAIEPQEQESNEA